MIWQLKKMQGEGTRVHVVVFVSGMVVAVEKVIAVRRVNRHIIANDDLD